MVSGMPGGHDTQLRGVASSARARRVTKLAGLIESAPPLTDEQVDALIARLEAHPRVQVAGLERCGECGKTR